MQYKENTQHENKRFSGVFFVDGKVSADYNEIVVISNGAFKKDSDRSGK